MFLEDVKVFKVSTFGPYTNIQAAVTAAIGNPPGVVIIPVDYAGTDTYTNTSNAIVLDFRQGSKNTGSNIGPLVVGGTGAVPMAVGGVPTGIAATASAAAPITGAAAANVFVTTLNLPTTVFNGVPFRVKAAGNIVATAGTYTATVQPLVYASTSAGFTASAAAAIYSAAAVNLTIASAATTKMPWNLSIEMSGDTTSGLVAGYYTGSSNNGAQQLVDLAVIANPPTSVSFSAAVPLQFLAGVTTTGATLGAGTVVNLTAFFIEA